jgi:hypothetical protein
MIQTRRRDEPHDVARLDDVRDAGTALPEPRAEGDLSTGFFLSAGSARSGIVLSQGSAELRRATRRPEVLP